ncbi:putative ABC transporter (fused ATP-binding and permease components) [Bradyrhizobium sp. ORS 285]|uniref:ABC transporter ATP-binding protein/permease n=1 Tax=Bradyrhizobium sp. ORS 285 TaxID=115808 RepID=UPI0002407E2A|nr:ABC transporter ATP-binding protein/permease [Bradyrhizobium sp. ORS 285]AKO22170.1 putative ABC transporter [Bradyrhizobium sp. ORS 285]CCD85023.1 putative ABC transporter (fused ATP-binding and permease components) [Bradyrhizobium sp. ORS 285]SMX60857.1 putative ABC transporter (fused ATP-binding and permease components) [Bradyrhizobium sp. ORS 285]
MNNLRSTLAIVWRIAIPYFRSEDKVAGRILLAAVIAIELALVAIDVLVNQWQNRFYNALQEYNWNSFIWEIGVFAVLATTFIVLAIYQLYLNQWLQIRWRRWLTETYMRHWLSNANHYRMQLKGDAADNPDQRIADDVKQFVEQTLYITVNLLSSVVTLASFVVILWGLSEAAPLTLFGMEYNIPGYLVWAALIYAIAGTALTHWIGSPLVNLNFEQQRFEADFRFNLVRVRENSEQIALLRGESAEHDLLSNRYGRVVQNWYQIMTRTKRLTAVTSGYSQVATIFPYVIVAPAYFAKKVQLGGMMQTASAFSSVQRALSFFVNTYRTLADWRSTVARLDGFEMSIASAVTLSGEPQTIDVVSHAGDSIELAQLLLKLPNGLPLIAADGFSFKSNQSMLLTGPSGAGKSTLFRAIAGVWPFGSGAISVPGHAKLMMLPQRPYFPIGALQTAVVYPAAPDAFSPEQVKDALVAVGLPLLAERLDEEAHWNRMLSLGEQQRLGIARALLHQPQFLFLDEATASLDEPSEARLYRAIAERLPQTTVVSIGHRSTLHDFHDRKVELVRDGDRFSLRPTGQAADAPAGGAE